ncbi:hypothetical protein Vafri_16128, partial [Volvox africanus]
VGSSSGGVAAHPVLQRMQTFWDAPEGDVGDLPPPSAQSLQQEQQARSVGAGSGRGGVGKSVQVLLSKLNALPPSLRAEIVQRLDVPWGVRPLLPLQPPSLAAPAPVTAARAGAENGAVPSPFATVTGAAVAAAAAAANATVGASASGAPVTMAAAEAAAGGKSSGGSNGRPNLQQQKKFSDGPGLVSEPSPGTVTNLRQGDSISKVPLLAINSRHRNPLPPELLPEISATAAAQYGASPPYAPDIARSPALAATVSRSSGLPAMGTTAQLAATTGMALPAVHLATTVAPGGSPPRRLTSSNGSSPETDAVRRSQATRRSLQPSEAFLSGKMDYTLSNGAGPVTRDHGSVSQPRVVAALQAAGLMANLSAPAPVTSSDGCSPEWPSTQWPTVARYRPSGKNTYQPTSAEVLLAKSIGMTQGTATATAAAAARMYSNSWNVNLVSAATRELASAGRAGNGGGGGAGSEINQSDRRLSSPPPLAAMLTALPAEADPRVMSYSSSGTGTGYAPAAISVKSPSQTSPPLPPLPMLGVRAKESGCSSGPAAAAAASAAAAAAASGGMDALLERLAAEAFLSSPHSQTPSLSASEPLPSATLAAGAVSGVVGLVQGHPQAFVTSAAAPAAAAAAATAATLTTVSNDASSVTHGVGGGGSSDLHLPSRTNTPPSAVVDERVRQQLQQLQQQLKRVQEQVTAVLSGDYGLTAAAESAQAVTVMTETATATATETETGMTKHQHQQEQQQVKSNVRGSFDCGSGAAAAASNAPALAGRAGSPRSTSTPGKGPFRFGAPARILGSILRSVRPPGGGRPSASPSPSRNATGAAFATHDMANDDAPGESAASAASGAAAAAPANTASGTAAAIPASAASGAAAAAPAVAPLPHQAGIEESNRFSPYRLASLTGTVTVNGGDVSIAAADADVIHSVEQPSTAAQNLYMPPGLPPLRIPRKASMVASAAAAVATFLRPNGGITSAAPPVAADDVAEVHQNQLKELEGQMLELQKLKLQLENQQLEQEEVLQQQQRAQRTAGGDRPEASWPVSGAGIVHEQQQSLQLQLLQQELVNVLQQVRHQEDALRLQHQQLEAQYHLQLQQRQHDERSREGEQGENTLYASGFENGVIYPAVADSGFVQSAASAAGEAEVLNVPMPDLTSWEPLPMPPPPPLRGPATAWSKWPRPLTLPSPPIQPYVVPPGYAVVSNEIFKAAAELSGCTNAGDGGGGGGGGGAAAAVDSSIAATAASAPAMVLLPMEYLPGGTMQEGISAISDVGGGGGGGGDGSQLPLSGSPVAQLDGVRLVLPAMVVVDSRALSPERLSMGRTTHEQQQQRQYHHHYHHATCRVGGSTNAERRSSRGSSVSKALLASHPLTLDDGTNILPDLS